MDLGFWICVSLWLFCVFFELGFAQIYWVLLILCCCSLCWVRAFFFSLFGVSDNEDYYTKVELS